MTLMRECLAAGAALMLLSVAAGSQDEPAVLVVYVEGIENVEGDILIDLFDSPESFMVEPFRNIATPAGDQSEFQIRFEDLPPGEYALSVLHDFNGDGQLERGVMGRAREPIAFSADARFGFAPPGFAEAAFIVDAGLNEIVIRF